MKVFTATVTTHLFTPGGGTWKETGSNGTGNALMLIISLTIKLSEQAQRLSTWNSTPDMYTIKKITSRKQIP